MSDPLPLPQPIMQSFYTTDRFGTNDVQFTPVPPGCKIVAPPKNPWLRELLRESEPPGTGGARSQKK